MRSLLGCPELFQGSSRRSVLTLAANHTRLNVQGPCVDSKRLALSPLLCWPAPGSHSCPAPRSTDDAAKALRHLPKAPRLAQALDVCDSRVSRTGSDLTLPCPANPQTRYPVLILPLDSSRICSPHPSLAHQVALPGAAGHPTAPPGAICVVRASSPC